MDLQAPALHWRMRLSPPAGSGDTMHLHCQDHEEEGRPRGHLRPRCITLLTWAERDGASNSRNRAYCTTASEKNLLPSPPRPPHIPLRQKGRRLVTSFLSSGQCDGNSKGGAGAEAASAPRGCGAWPATRSCARLPASCHCPSQGPSPAQLHAQDGKTKIASLLPKDQPRNANLLPCPGGAAAGRDSTFTGTPKQNGQVLDLIQNPLAATSCRGKTVIAVRGPVEGLETRVFAIGTNTAIKSTPDTGGIFHFREKKNFKNQDSRRHFLRTQPGGQNKAPREQVPP